MNQCITPSFSDSAKPYGETRPDHVWRERPEEPEQRCQHGVLIGSFCRLCPEMAATTNQGCEFCPDPVAPGTEHVTFSRSHATCIEAEHLRRMTAWAKAHPFDSQHEPGYRCRYGPADIRILERDSPEGQEQLRRREERKAAQSVVAGDVARLAGVA